MKKCKVTGEKIRSSDITKTIGNRSLASKGIFDNRMLRGNKGKVEIQRAKGKYDALMVETETTIKYNCTIGVPHNVALIVAIAGFMHELGKDNIDKIKHNPSIMPIVGGGGVDVPTTRIAFNLRDMSQRLYGSKNNVTQVIEIFEELEQVYIRTRNKVKGKKGSIRATYPICTQLTNDEGKLNFSIANIHLLQIMQSGMGIFLDNILEHTNTTRALALFIEMHQYRVSEKGRTLPRQVYKISDIVGFWNTEDKYKRSPGRTIEAIQKSFNEMHKKNSSFPQYFWNKDKGWFESKFKNGHCLPSEYKQEIIEW